MPRSDRQPIVELNIGGTIIPANQYLDSFELTKKPGIWSGQFVLFDPEWTNIEALALESGFGTEIKFRYGWEDKMTNWITGQMKGYTPEFENDGVKITIEWIFGSAASTRVVRNVVYKSGMKISDIVRRIADDNGWGVDEIEPTVGTFENPFVQDNISDISFIKNVLVPRAINNDGIGGYQVILEKDILSFSTFCKRNKQVYKTYIVQRGVDGEVIRFAPTDNVAKMAQMGAHKVKVLSFDPINKKVLKKETGIDDFAVTLVDDGGKVSGIVDIKRNKMNNRVILKPFHRKEEVDAYAKTRYTEFAQWMYQADAEILGDPFVPVMGYTEWMVITPTGMMHYLSGVYQNFEIKDTIGNGEFTTSLVLRRTSAGKGSETIKAIKQNLIKMPIKEGVMVKVVK